MSKGWKVLERHELLDRSPWMKVYAETVQLEDGQTVIPDFYHIALPHFVAIFSVTTEGKIPIIEQYRHAIGQITRELPSGLIEPGESPLDAAKRELLEETGLEALTWRPIGSFIIDPNRGCGQCHAFLALRARQVAAPDGEGELQEQTVHFYSVNELRTFFLAGQCVAISSIATIGLGLAHLNTLSPD